MTEKMLAVYDDLRFFPNRLRREKAVVTIGNFDGLHRGHRELIRQTDALKNQIEQELSEPVIRLLLTFTPHPQEIMQKMKSSSNLKGGGEPYRKIYTEEERAELVEETGMIDEMVMLTFEEAVMTMEPRDFYEKILRERYHALGIVVGANFRFGNRGSGTAQLLKEYCEQDHLSCCIVPDIAQDGETISSSRIKRLLDEGKAEKAWEMLERPYFVEGVVSQGKHLGRRLETPTVNVGFAEGQLVPARGVYISRTYIDGTMYESISNVGINPTFGGEEPRSETFVFDFAGDLYGQKIRIEFLKHIRPEKRFENAEALKEQLREDIDKTRKYFESGTQR